MGKLISFKEFFNDLIANIEFRGEEIGDDFSEFNRWKVRLFSGGVQDKIYSQNTGCVADYFYYKGEKFSFSGEDIVAYGSRSILRNVQGYIDPARVDEIKELIKNALDAFKNIERLAKADYCDVKMDYPYEKAIYIAQKAYYVYVQLFKKSIEHVLEPGCKYCAPQFEKFVNESVYRYGGSVDWSLEQFQSYFDFDKVLDFLFDNFKPVELSNSFHKKSASSIAYRFKSHTKLKSGIRLKESWRYLGNWDSPEDGFLSTSSYHCKRVELLLGLKACFDYSQKLDGVAFIDGVFDDELGMGSNKVGKGISIRVYKEHYAVTLDKEYLDCVLLYLNKFSQDLLREVMAA